MKQSNCSLGYVCCPVENRQALLMELLSRHYDRQDKAWNRKIVIVFSHDNSIRFYTELFQRLRQLPIMPVLKADLSSNGGLDDYSLFQDSETGAMAVSSATASSLDNLQADKIIQFDPPRGIKSVSKLSSQCSDYLLFLRPQEVGFVPHLQKCRATLRMEERYVPWDSVQRMPKQKIQQWYISLHSMNINSKASYKAYMDSIRDHKISDIFSLDGILIKEVAEGYCLPVPPYYKLVNETPRHEQEIARKEENAATLVIPATAKVVKTTFKRLPRDDDSDHEMEKRNRQANKDRMHARKGKKKILRDDEVVMNEDGTVELGRDVVARYHHNLTRQRLVTGKRSEMKGLRKQLRNSDGSVKTSTRLGNQKRRRPIKIPKSMQ